MARVIKINQKFTEKDIDTFIKEVFADVKSEKYLFDLSDTDWMSNQNLLLFTAVINHFFEMKVDFKIKLYGDNVELISRRQAVQIINLWDTWKIYLSFNNEIERYTNLTSLSVLNYLKKKYSISSNLEIYQRLGVTPFIKFKKLFEFDDKVLLEKEIKPVFRLNDVINRQLVKYNSYHPFTKGILSEIITKELFENSLDHAGEVWGKGIEHSSFMSIGLKARTKKYFIKKRLKEIFDKFFLDNSKGLIEYFKEHDLHYSIEDDSFLEIISFLETNGDLNEINWKKFIEELKVEANNSEQNFLKRNFQNEELSETIGFFQKNGVYSNAPLLQYSFVDFGKGIINTIQEEYHKDPQTPKDNMSDNDILAYAFNYYSSRHPISSKYLTDDFTIIRGLFDVLIIVRRYKGLLIVRSNKGKIFYDFSDESQEEIKFQTFGNNLSDFPGTFVTIYLPALQNDSKFKSSKINNLSAPNFNRSAARNIYLYQLVNKFEKKENLYSKFFLSLTQKLSCKSSESFLTYINFKGLDDNRLIKKTIEFLLTNKAIHFNNSIVIICPPSEDILVKIEESVLELSSLEKSFYIHPIPVFYETFNSIKTHWLGVSSIRDKEKLDNTLSDYFSLTKYDFDDFNSVLGNTFELKADGTLVSKVPKYKTLMMYYNHFEDKLLEKLLEEYECIKSAENNGLFLCNGNYYQKYFIQLTDLLSDYGHGGVLSKLLFDKIEKEINDIDSYLFLVVTTASYLIVKNLIQQNLIKEKNIVFLDNYLNFDNDKNLNKIKKGDKVILMCDTVATGNLVVRLNKIVREKGASMDNVAVLINTIDEGFSDSISFLKEFKGNIIYLKKQSIIKKRKTDFDDEFLNLYKKGITRINPNTNSPITLSIKDSTFINNVILDNEVILTYIDEEELEIKFQIKHNLIHPYYFNLNSILKRENEILSEGEKVTENDLEKFSLLYTIFKKLKEKKVIDFSKPSIVLYPIESGIENVNFSLFTDKVLDTHNVEYYLLDRYKADYGWIFAHNLPFKSEYLIDKNILIFDDGSCTGDSLMQMLNEITTFSPQNVVLVSIVGRVDDYKLEFYSKLSVVNKSSVNVFFGSHWHVSTYHPEKNPYNEEVNLLRSLLKISNTPEAIQAYSRNILNEITPEVNKESEFKYLLRIPLKNSDRITQKEIFIVRNEIGKVIGYRVYKESFEWFTFNILDRFDTFDFSDKNNNRNLEILTICLIYEPYLFEKLIRVLPEIKTILEEFGKKMLFNEIEDLGEDKFFDNFSLNWKSNRKYRLFLFFIVFNHRRFFDLINQNSSILDDLFKVSSKSIKSFNYLLFKISKFFFELDENHVYKEIRKNIIEKLIAYTHKEDLNSEIISIVKIFQQFTLSVSIEKTNSVLVLAIINYYRLIADINFHNENLYSDKQVLSSLYLEIGRKMYLNESWEEDLLKIEEYSKNIFDFCNTILSFSLKNKEFFLNEDNWNALENSEESLRKLFKELYNYTFDAKIVEPLKCNLVLNKIFVGFIEKDSFLFKIFDKFNTQKFLKLLYDELVNSEQKFIINGNIIEFMKDGKLFGINIPNYYTSIIIKEIINNLRHSKKEVFINCSINEGFLEIEMKNEIDYNNKKGGSKGSKLFRNLQNNLIYESDYSKDTNGTNFLQKFKFKIV